MINKENEEPKSPQLLKNIFLFVCVGEGCLAVTSMTVNAFWWEKQLYVVLWAFINEKVPMRTYVYPVQRRPLWYAPYIHEQMKAVQPVPELSL